MIGVYTEVPRYGWTVGAAFNQDAIGESFNQTSNLINLIFHGRGINRSSSMVLNFANY